MISLLLVYTCTCRYFSEFEEDFGELSDHHLFVGVRSPYSVSELYLEDLPEHFGKKLSNRTSKRHAASIHVLLHVYVYTSTWRTNACPYTLVVFCLI